MGVDLLSFDEVAAEVLEKSNPEGINQYTRGGQHVAGHEGQAKIHGDLAAHSSTFAGSQAHAKAAEAHKKAAAAHKADTDSAGAKRASANAEKASIKAYQTSGQGKWADDL